MVKINRLCFMCGYRCCVCESLLVFTDLLALHYLQTIILLLDRQYNTILLLELDILLLKLGIFSLHLYLHPMCMIERIPQCS